MNCIARYLIACAFVLVLAIPALSQANANFPLVIVVHGIGGGNRNPGWAREFERPWGVEVHEVTFRYQNRDTITSYTDFYDQAGDWALSVQSQMKEIVRQNPGRRVMIVTHSWGTVATKMALAGGLGGGNSRQLIEQGNHIDALSPNDFEVEELVTLGSPLGDAGEPELANDFLKWRLVVPGGRPSIVKHWTNIFDVADPVSSKSQNLSGADNVPVTGSGYAVDQTGLSAHTGIWTNRQVNQHIFDTALRISNLPRLPVTRVGDVTSPPIESKPSTGANADEKVVAEYRALLPAVLQKNKKPWHTRINILANAEKQGSGYRVNYQTFCQIEKGPDAGKDYMCFEFEKVFDLAGLRGAVAEMKQQLGR